MANLFDNFSEREIEEVARVNAGAFYGMMGALVKRSSELYPAIEDIAEVLGVPVEEASDFYLGGSDPTISEVEEHALALGVKIGITCTPIEPRGDGRNDDGGADEICPLGSCEQDR